MKRTCNSKIRRIINFDKTVDATSQNHNIYSPIIDREELFQKCSSLGGTIIKTKKHVGRYSKSQYNVNSIRNQKVLEITKSKNAKFIEIKDEQQLSSDGGGGSLQGDGGGKNNAISKDFRQLSDKESNCLVSSEGCDLRLVDHVQT